MYIYRLPAFSKSSKRFSCTCRPSRRHRHDAISRDDTISHFIFRCRTDSAQLRSRQAPSSGPPAFVVATLEAEVIHVIAFLRFNGIHAMFKKEDVHGAPHAMPVPLKDDTTTKDHHDDDDDTYHATGARAQKRCGHADHPTMIRSYAKRRCTGIELSCTAGKCTKDVH